MTSHDGRSEQESSMIDAFVAYHEALYFLAPDIRRRYYRLYGDLEYDRASLRAEIAVMELRIREVLRRARSHASITANEEREISSTSHELGSHLYRHLQTLHANIVRARAFRYDHQRERHGRFLLHDIATAILGVADDELRGEQAGELTAAAAAYGAVNIGRLVEIHDVVQKLLSMQRRDTGADSTDDPISDWSREREEWLRRRDDIYSQYPLVHSNVLDSPAGITQHEARLRRRIAQLQSRLERTTIVYDGLVATTRYRN